jgi:molecular chaperone GrpE
MQSRIKFASQPLALNIITGLDNLERALEQAKEEENEQLKEFVRGVEMVQQHLFEALKQNNIERVYPKGEQFDPNKHEAMGVIETDDIEPDHIAEVFQAGYFLHDRVIRPAMVQVAKKK